eukprot:Nitzschia sp. Nitz4//scaffold35_size145790//36141//37764//NITZ4_003016-RA/size145790-augustus-gene-0.131-mRNA-1//-1//CDS//3329549082//4744//frame0
MYKPVLRMAVARSSRRMLPVAACRLSSSLRESIPDQDQQVISDMFDAASDTSTPPAATTPQGSPSELVYTGDTKIPVTSHLHIVAPGEATPSGTWPVFRIMDEDGHFRDGTSDGAVMDSTPAQAKALSAPSENTSLANLRQTLKSLYPFQQEEIDRNGLLFPSTNEYPDISSNDTLFRAYTQVIRIREMDKILQNAQRQGRISFYMTCHGEEAIHIGAASALDLQDTVLAQYREQGLLMWRGFTLQQFTDQCFSNQADLGKGRQMPIHYGSRALNYQTISSPLGTQIPQAVGVGYRHKVAGKKAVSICFFGDGCASTTDFHSGMNFAATLGSPVLFFCRNNGYAISTPVTEQFRGDGIISRAPGYGMAAIRVDGNDVFAVHAAVREARNYAVENQAPVLIEAMTYRQGHHSTSDDSLRYRSADEVQRFVDSSDPIIRLQNFMERHYNITAADKKAMENQQKADVLEAMKVAERKPKPALEELFKDVYYDMPASLQEQQRELMDHLEKFPNEYN